MRLEVIAASTAAMILFLLVCLQLALAAGLPFGHVAWGGQHRVLPTRLRLGSLAAAVVLALAAWIILARSSLMPPGPQPLAIRIGTWIFAGYLLLNTLGNLASKSRLERWIMTPLTLVLAASFLVVALGPH